MLRGSVRKHSLAKGKGHFMKKAVRIVGIVLMSAFLCFGLMACGGGNSKSKAENETASSASSASETTPSYTSPNGFTRAYGTSSYPGAAYAFFALNDSEDYGAFIAVGKAKSFSSCYVGNMTKSEESGNRVYTIDATDLATEFTVTVTGMSDEKCTGWTGSKDTATHNFNMKPISVEDFDNMAQAIQGGNYEFTNPLE